MNYKEMYLKMMRASERVINILVQTQQECEELYLSQTENSSTDEKDSSN